MIGPVYEYSSYGKECYSALGGVFGGMPPPRKILNFRPFEIVSETVLGQNSRLALFCSIEVASP